MDQEGGMRLGACECVALFVTMQEQDRRMRDSDSAMCSGQGLFCAGGRPSEVGLDGCFHRVDVYLCVLGVEC